METLRALAIEKLESDMIFIFECDGEEKASAYNHVYEMSEEELIEYIDE